MGISVLPPPGQGSLPLVTLGLTQDVMRPRCEVEVDGGRRALARETQWVKRHAL